MEGQQLMSVNSMGVDIEGALNMDILIRIMA